MPMNHEQFQAWIEQAGDAFTFIAGQLGIQGNNLMTLQRQVTEVATQFQAGMARIDALEAAVKQLQKDSGHVDVVELVADDSKDHTAAVRKALLAGAADGHVVRLVGEFRMTEGVHIPHCAEGFGIDGTDGKLVDASTKGIAGLLEIGMFIQPTNNFPLRPADKQVPLVEVMDVARGSQVIQVRTVGAVDVRQGSIALLWDEHEYVASSDAPNAGATSVMNHAELVFINQVTSQGVLSVNHPIGRDYSGKVRLSLLQEGFDGSVVNRVQGGVVIHGLHIDGADKAGSQGLIKLGCTVGFKITGCTVTGFNTQGILIQDSSHTHIAGCTVRPSGHGIGAGYGIQIGRGSRFTNVEGVDGWDADAHPGYTIVMGHSGAQDCVVSKVDATAGTLGTHGMDCQRFIFRDSHVAHVELGNNVHLAGGSGHVVEAVHCEKEIRVQANTVNCAIFRSTATQLVLNSANRAHGNPSSGKPETLKVVDSLFDELGTGSTIIGDTPYHGWVGRVLFQGCTFRRLSAAHGNYGGILSWREGLEGIVIFTGCTFVTDQHSFWKAMLEVANKSAMAGELVLDSCKFICTDTRNQNEQNCVLQIPEWKTGHIVAKHNRFYCANPSKAVVVQAWTQLPANSQQEDNTVHPLAEAPPVNIPAFT
jgi:hypothetical protein